MERTYNPKKRVKSYEKRTYNKPAKVEKLEKVEEVKEKVEKPIKKKSKKDN